MITPFDVEDRIKDIRAWNKNLREESHGWADKAISKLYAGVLEEIEKGSIDPKSLAHAALRLRASWDNERKGLV